MTRPTLPPSPQGLGALDAVPLRRLSAGVEQAKPEVTPQSVEVLPALLHVVEQGLTGEVREWIAGELAERVRVGTQRYGQPLMTFNERMAGVDLEQELLDAALYAQQMILEASALGQGARVPRLLRVRGLILGALVEVGRDDRLGGGAVDDLGLGGFGVRGADLEAFGRSGNGGAP